MERLMTADENNSYMASTNLLAARKLMEEMKVHTRETSLVITKIDEALLWLGREMELKRGTHSNSTLLGSKDT